MNFAELNNYLISKDSKSKVYRIEGKGNSLVVRWLSSGVSYLIKLYPTDINWDRQGVEENLYICFKKMGIFNIPKLYWVDKKNNISCFEYINESKTKNYSSEIEISIYEFIYSISNKSNPKINIRHAKESFFSLNELISQIQIRINYLKELKIPELKEHLIKIENGLKKVKLPNIDAELFKKKIISPSDFGPHNLIQATSGRFYFFDFEYGGWDNLYKLLCDFYWHEGFDWSKKRRVLIIDKFLKNKIERKVFNVIKFYMGFKWALIVLNEFNPEIFEKRKAAKGYKFNYRLIKKQQLNKSKKILSLLNV